MRRLPAVIAFGMALAVAPPTQALDVAQYPELEAFIAEMGQRHGFSARQLTRLFARARVRPEIIQAMERPKEALPWYEYRKLFLTEERAREGAAFWRRHARLLARAQAEYGVPAASVVAILRVGAPYRAHRGGARRRLPPRPRRIRPARARAAARAVARTPRRRARVPR